MDGYGRVAWRANGRDGVGGGCRVVGAMGRRDAAWIGAARHVYDPVVHYKEVRDKWLGLSITHSDGRHEAFEAEKVAPASADYPVK